MKKKKIKHEEKRKRELYGGGILHTLLVFSHAKLIDLQDPGRKEGTNARSSLRGDAYKVTRWRDVYATASPNEISRPRPSRLPKTKKFHHKDQPLAGEGARASRAERD